MYLQGFFLPSGVPSSTSTFPGFGLPDLGSGAKAGERQTPVRCTSGFAKFQGATQSSSLLAVEAEAGAGGILLGPLQRCQSSRAARGHPSRQEASRPPLRPVSGAGAGKSCFCCSFSSEPPIRSLPGDISLERTSSPSPPSPVPNVKQTGRQCSWKPPRLPRGASASEGRWEGGWGVRARGTFIGAQSHSHGCSGGPAEGKGLELPRDLFPGSAVLFLLLPDGLQSRLGGGGRFAWQALLV